MDKEKPGIDSLIRMYDLTPHPEGGYFREIFRSQTAVVSPVHDKSRSSVTHIYFLLGQDDVSRFHKVVHDEIWNFYEGSPLALYRYDGKTTTRARIGPGCNAYTAVVQGNAWQAAESTGPYSLVGCTVAPGFDFEDFSFLSDSPNDLKAFKQEQDAFKRFL